MAKILQIEDDNDQVILYQMKLEASGFTFISAESGQKGIKMAETEQPDIILVDLMMPDMGGIEVLERLKKNSKTQSIPVIIVTNVDEQHMAEKAMELGAADFIVKSRIPLRDMVKRIESHLVD